jgi:hypothetical protein
MRSLFPLAFKGGRFSRTSAETIDFLSVSTSLSWAPELRSDCTEAGRRRVRGWRFLLCGAALRRHIAPALSGRPRCGSVCPDPGVFADRPDARPGITAIHSRNRMVPSDVCLTGAARRQAERLSRTSAMIRLRTKNEREMLAPLRANRAHAAQQKTPHSLSSDDRYGVEDARTATI